jgi:uncharacterized OB-fold protein
VGDAAASVAALEDDIVSLAGTALRTEGGLPVLFGGACAACGTRTFPQQNVCPSCMSEDINEEAMPRRGSVYSYSTMHVGAPRWHVPFSVGYVDLPNGVRVFTHLDAAAAKIGAEVEVGQGVVGTDRDGAPVQTFVFKLAEI